MRLAAECELEALAGAPTQEELVLIAPGSGRPEQQRRTLRALESYSGRTSRISLAVDNLPGRLRGKQWYEKQHSRWLSLYRLDVFFLPYQLSPYLEKELPDIPVAVQVFDVIPIKFPHLARPVSLDAARRARDCWTKRAQVVLAPSRAARADIAGLGFPEDRVVVAPLGAAGGFRPREKARARAVLGLHGVPEKFILFVGSTEPRKNVPALIRAVGTLARQRAFHHDLLLVGQAGWGHAAVVDAIREHGLQERVHHLGRVPDEDLPLLYNLADCFAFPSWYEGFGLPVLEAFASGCPVVTSATPALHELSAGAALEVEPSDVEGLSRAIERVLGEPELAAAMVEKGLARAREFSWERTGTAVLEGLKQAATMRGREEARLP